MKEQRIGIMYERRDRAHGVESAPGAVDSAVALDLARKAKVARIKDVLFPHDFMERERSVQLAELGLESWKEHRWIASPGGYFS